MFKRKKLRYVTGAVAVIAAAVAVLLLSACGGTKGVQAVDLGIPESTAVTIHQLSY